MVSLAYAAEEVANEIANDDDDFFMPLPKLTKDIKEAAKLISDDQARFLVYNYYQFQKSRIRANNQSTALEKADKPNATVTHFTNIYDNAENQLKKTLDIYSGSKPIGIWLRSQKGIGPVIASGIIAHVDITKASTAGQIQRFAGLDPTLKWEKGKKRPFNAELKVVFWKLGESFVKVSNRGSIYGEFYKNWKVIITAKSNNLEYADQAKEILENKKIDKDTEAYKAYIQGKLPPAHIHARAKRKALQLFIGHLHEVWFELHHNIKAPAPYAISLTNHSHYIPPPGPSINEINRFL